MSNAVMPNSALLLIVGGIFVLGLSLHIWSVRQAPGTRHGIQVPVLLCYVSSVTVLLFAVFPESTTGGKALGFRLGGAAAYAIVLWLIVTRLLRQANASDAADQALADRDAVIAALREELAAIGAHQRPTALVGADRVVYQVLGARAHAIGLFSGELRNVSGIDAWVNSENVDMEMSRHAERTVSGYVRWAGAHLDMGRVVVDQIRDELRTRTDGRRPVAPATAILTGAGELTQRHGVQVLVHVAAVEGSAASGYRQVPDVGLCVTNAMAAVDTLNADGGKVHTMLIPLLGTGMGHGDIRRTAHALVASAEAYFILHPTSRLETVYFLAGTDVQRDICVQVLEEHAGLRRKSPRRIPPRQAPPNVARRP